jgi:urease accessory protein
LAFITEVRRTVVVVVVAVRIAFHRQNGSRSVHRKGTDDKRAAARNLRIVILTFESPVGVWGAQLGVPAIWILPVVFPVMMAVGGLIGFLGVSLPGTEVGIALSMIVLGGAIMLRARPQLGPVIAIVAFFGICHGYAHGMELPHGESLLYSVGFVLATGFLHLIGIAMGLIYRSMLENRECVTAATGRSGTGLLTL